MKPLDHVRELLQAGPQPLPVIQQRLRDLRAGKNSLFYWLKTGKVQRIELDTRAGRYVGLCLPGTPPERIEQARQQWEHAEQARQQWERTERARRPCEPVEPLPVQGG